MKAGREDGKFSVGDIQAKMVSIADASGEQCYHGVTMLAWADVLYMINRFNEVSLSFLISYFSSDDHSPSHNITLCLDWNSAADLSP